MTPWQSDYKVRREHGNLAKTLRRQFRHSYDSNLARNNKLGIENRFSKSKPWTLAEESLLRTATDGEVGGF